MLLFNFLIISCEVSYLLTSFLILGLLAYFAVIQKKKIKQNKQSRREGLEFQRLNEQKKNQMADVSVLSDGQVVREPLVSQSTDPLNTGDPTKSDDEI